MTCSEVEQAVHKLKVMAHARVISLWTLGGSPTLADARITFQGPAFSTASWILLEAMIVEAVVLHGSRDGVEAPG